MWSVISAILQLIIFFTKNKFEKDKEERARKDALYVDAKKAIVSGDVSGITSILDSVRS